jgi:hypothetical protein
MALDLLSSPRIVKYRCAPPPANTSVASQSAMAIDLLSSPLLDKV